MAGIMAPRPDSPLAVALRSRLVQGLGLERAVKRSTDSLARLNALIGLLVRDAESAGLVGLLPVILLVFTSSTFVPIATMPGWLEAFATINPVTVIVEALRALCLGGPTATNVWQAVAWIGGLLAFTIPAAVTQYRRTTAG